MKLAGQNKTPEATPLPIADDFRLTTANLQPILAAARQRWADTGLTSEQLAVIDSLQFEVADLAGWCLGATSDRVGCRLEGEPLRHRGPAEILSDGMVPGAIQVPPDGRPIVMGADGPTTGGYPKIATVLTADLPLLAQLVPGEGEVRFEAVPAEG